MDGGWEECICGKYMDEEGIVEIPEYVRRCHIYKWPYENIADGSGREEKIRNLADLCYFIYKK